jgi:hypothetical protein
MTTVSKQLVVRNGFQGRNKIKTWNIKMTKTRKGGKTAQEFLKLNI